MSTMTLAPTLFDFAGVREQLIEESRAFDHPPLEPTLEDLIVGAWHEVTLGVPAECPVCHGELKSVWSQGPRPVGGRCADCGTCLS